MIEFENDQERIGQAGAFFRFETLMTAMTRQAFRWREASLPDLVSVSEIQLVVHEAFPEDDHVLADRLELSPEGCFMLEVGGVTQGYVLSHPWIRRAPPALNAVLGEIPETADTWYIHDLALLPETRGSGAGGNVVPLLADIARSDGYHSMSLVSVNGSRGFWERQGFSVRMDERLASKLASYGEDALYMERLLA
ncbi:GNAT family N-acetyltransferase [Ensifer sp. Root31]|uniref:GNAT family N-acetyltransferase n=3 Tax=Sinorhizobium/Ensifer group TaxID=227292 RepID=UPI000A7A072D|nr:GNAT family N-acetyltransferase [Ensifer sp. Root31]